MKGGLQVSQWDHLHWGKKPPQSTHLHLQLAFHCTSVVWIRKSLQKSLVSAYLQWHSIGRLSSPQWHFVLVRSSAALTEQRHHGEVEDSPPLRPGTKLGPHFQVEKGAHLNQSEYSIQECSVAQTCQGGRHLSCKLNSIH